MAEKLTGALVYDRKAERYDIRLGFDDYLGGISCGYCFEIKVGSRWIQTRMEMSDDWYLVGVKGSKGRDLTGLLARVCV